MRTLCCFLLFAGVLLADVTGKWSGSFDIKGPDGEIKANTAFLDLKQSGDKITGTGGPNEQEQMPIANGKIDGNVITFDVVHGEGAVIKCSLRVEDDHIRGEVNGDDGDGNKVAGKIDVTRVK